MTRRRFIQKIISTTSAAIAGVLFIAQKTLPRKFVRAVKLNKFPGSVKPLQKIESQGKWSG
jgi:hypothetical protein